MGESGIKAFLFWSIEDKKEGISLFSGKIFGKTLKGYNISQFIFDEGKTKTPRGKKGTISCHRCTWRFLFL